MDSVHELELEARIGLEAGEVVVEDGDSTFATGEAVNVAARLQQAASPGEIRLGPGARRLAAGAAEVEDAGPIEIKGRSEPVWTWRAVRVLEGRSRLVEAPFVGREAELELLENTFARAVRNRRAQLVTVFGEAGLERPDWSASSSRASSVRQSSPAERCRTGKASRTGRSPRW